MRFAAILGPAMFQWGAAVGHIHEIVATGNMAPGNAGIMLYSDILLPFVGFALLWFKRKALRSACVASLKFRRFDRRFHGLRSRLGWRATRWRLGGAS